MRAAHREHRGARREALVENIDLRVGITAELKREQAEQHRLAGTRRSDDHHMPNVADMRGQAERRRAACLGVKRSAERRVGQECVSPCGYRGVRYTSKKKKTSEQQTL